MHRKTLMKGLMLFVFASLGLSLLTASAVACDHPKTAIQARQGILKTFTGTTSPLAAQLANGGIPVAPGKITAAATMTGLWHVKDYYQGDLIDEYFDTWHSDGNELFIDATNPAADNVCQGIWVPAGSLTFKLKHMSWYFDDSGNVLGYVVFQDLVTLAGDGNSWHGSENVYVYDMDGNLQGEYLGDELHATRITVDF